MGTSKREQVPPDLIRGRSRFLAWRGQRKPGDRIPQPLWAMATRLANSHGVSRTAKVLGLDYDSVKERVEADAGASQASGPAFVEVASPVVIGKQCHFELDNGAGATLRGQLMGYDASDLEALARGFRGDR
jgi:hypothetical protein